MENYREIIYVNNKTLIIKRAYAGCNIHVSGAQNGVLIGYAYGRGILAKEQF
jgi:hypothetical protein